MLRRDGPDPEKAPILLVAIAGGGLVGAAGRWWVGLLLPSADSGFAWGTWTVNVSGALAMGLLVAWLETAVKHPWIRPVLAVGVLGGWTTFSSLVLDLHTLTTRYGSMAVGPYLVLTLTLGVAACLAGMWLGERIFGPERA